MFIVNPKEQYEYSKKKLPELQQRFNDEQLHHEKKCELLRSKMERHGSIIDDYEMRGDNNE